MTVTVKNKTPLVVPSAVRRRAGLKSGDELEFKVSGGVITILPKLPNADDEYTPAQRRAIDGRLARAEADIKRGRVYGPFETNEEMIDFLHDQVKKRNAKRKAKTTAKSR